MDDHHLAPAEDLEELGARARLHRIVRDQAPVRAPAGRVVLAGLPGLVPAPPRVRPIAVLDGLICITPAALRIGIETADAPELNSPR